MRNSLNLPFVADVICGWSLARQCGVAAVARPGDVVAAQHDGLRRGEESVDVKCGFATLEEQMRQDRTDGDDSVEIGRYLYANSIISDASL